MNTLSVPTIMVNNDVVGIVPNTFKYTSGDGETKVRAASVGGGNADPVHTRDAESMFSTVMFSMYVRGNEISKIRDWKANTGNNTVLALQRGEGDEKDFSIPFVEMSVTNDPDINAAADGVIEIEMAGRKLE